MPYIARVCIELGTDISSYEKEKWHTIKSNNNIEYRWRFCNNHTYEVIAGVFNDKNTALQCSKQMYVTTFYSLIRGGFSIRNAGCSWRNGWM